MGQSTADRKYKRVLLKLSGEALQGDGDFGIDPSVLNRMALEIGQLVGIGVQVGLVVGGGNLWFGLLQIYPDTARRYGCRARTGDALTDPEDNLSCAARILAVTVPRDRAVAVHDGRWRGVAADWGPMTNRSKIAEMSAWTRQQSYCVPLESIRPRVRPAGLGG